MSDHWRTEHLLARRPGSSDQSGYRALFLDPAVGEWLRPAPMEPFDDGAILAMLGADQRHWVEHGFGPWVLVEEATGSIVGRGGLQWTEVRGGRVAELPWTIGSPHWGRGLATEAAAAASDWARSLRLPEVVALIMSGNLASRRVAEKAGLRLDGETRHAGLPHLVYRLAFESPPAEDPPAELRR